MKVSELDTGNYCSQKLYNPNTGDGYLIWFEQDNVYEFWCYPNNFKSRGILVANTTNIAQLACLIYSLIPSPSDLYTGEPTT